MDDASIIYAINARFADLYNQGDIDKLTGIFSETAMVMLAKTDIIEGRKNISSSFKFMKRHVSSIRNKTLELSLFGAVAIEVGVYEHFDAQSNVLDSGKFLVVWRKFGNEWLINKDSLSTNKR